MRKQLVEAFLICVQALSVTGAGKPAVGQVPKPPHAVYWNACAGLGPACLDTPPRHHRSQAAALMHMPHNTCRTDSLDKGREKGHSCDFASLMPNLTCDRADR